MIVSVPATSANIGPGFDSLGLALSLRNRFEIELSTRDELIGCDPSAAGSDNLFLVAAREAATRVGASLPSLRVRFDCEIPMARGLGSSATLIVGGILAAKAVLGPQAAKALDRRTILDLAATLEGHPDNTTPALLGGFTVAVMAEGRTTETRGAVGKDLAFSALVPPFPLQTSVARAALPATIPFADAAANAGRAALVAAAFLTRDWDQLAIAVQDRLHEPWRAPLIPGFDEARLAAREAGALAVWLSGAGPTVIAVSRKDETEFSRRMEEICAAMRPQPWRHLLLSADDEGARVESLWNEGSRTA